VSVLPRLDECIDWTQCSSPESDRIAARLNGHSRFKRISADWLISGFLAISHLGGVGASIFHDRLLILLASSLSNRSGIASGWRRMRAVWSSGNMPRKRCRVVDGEAAPSTREDPFI